MLLGFRNNAKRKRTITFVKICMSDNYIERAKRKISKRKRATNIVAFNDYKNCGTNNLCASLS